MIGDYFKVSTYFDQNLWMILQELIDSGVIGEVIHIQHLEPVSV